MFKSKRRPINIPQSEHLKLAGTLAMLWGNEQFDPPPVPHTSFIAGVGLHDRVYGYVDVHPVGEMAEADWLRLTRRGFYQSFSDPAADLIARLHLLRLVRSHDSPARTALAEEISRAIQGQADKDGFDLELYERVDRITNFCDTVSFGVCFEAPFVGSVPVYPRNGSNEQVKVSFVFADGRVTVDPWPFAVESQRGYLVGYQAEGYPTKLDPVIVPYLLEQASAS